MKTAGSKQKLTAAERDDILKTLRERFAANPARHDDVDWPDVEARLLKMPSKLWSLAQMQLSGGDPDVVGVDSSTGEFLFVDCSPETPKGRVSICYDPEALASRKENKPRSSALGMASEMGVEILTEAQYRHLQTLGQFDRKTSSWILTPADVRELGGALFCDRRYGKVFLYHNGAESYYAARGFRGLLRV
jgi:hypothetical protein